MTKNCILIYIHCEIVKKKRAVYFPSWSTELANYISGIVKLNDFKIITINRAPNPTYLVTHSKTEHLNYRQLEENPGSSRNPVHFQPHTEGQFKWKSGLGFSFSFANNREIDSEAGFNLKPVQFDHLIAKYLEFLCRFNTAYDDDMFLNMSFYETSTTQVKLLRKREKSV